MQGFVEALKIYLRCMRPVLSHSYVGFVTTVAARHITLCVCCAGLHLKLKSRSDHWERKERQRYMKVYKNVT